MWQVGCVILPLLPYIYKRYLLTLQSTSHQHLLRVKGIQGILSPSS